MVKLSRKKSRKCKRRSYKSRKQRGGTTFTSEERETLERMGFFDTQINELENLNIPIHVIIDKFAEITSKQADEYRSDGNSDDFIEEVMNELKRYNKITGGRRRKFRKTRKSRKGGMCYGSGVGANSTDPNFSIYNTRELQLFPYRPTN